MVDAPMKKDEAAGRQDADSSSRIGFAGGRRSPRSPGEALQPDVAPPPPPPTPRRRRPIVATASGILSFIGIAAIASFALFYLGLEKISAPGPLEADKIVYIETGTDTGGIVEQLQRDGVIDSWQLMTGALYLKGERGKIKAGEYLFKQRASLNDVIDTLVSGKQILHSITLPEGLTSEQILQRLKDDPILIGDVRSTPKEGTLMPNTYKFARGTKREQIVASMQDKLKKVVDEIWAHRSADLPIRSPFEMITLASIVEKETGKADERPRVAGVFINRLMRNIPLQSDPTIVYGLVGGKGTLGRGILKSELEQRTPYNTYTISGLPPGPICNPGRAAMEAVANPSRTKEIYFVADGTGGHAFAETLDQHKANVARWRQIEKDAKDKSAPDADKLMPLPGDGAPAKQQRGEGWPSVPVYGALNTDFAGAVRVASIVPMIHDLETTDYPTSLADEDHVLSKVQSMLPARSAAVDPAGPSADGDDFGGIAGLETTNSTVVPRSAEERGFDQPVSGGPMITFPVSAARRADEKAAAAQFGLSAGSDKLPPQTDLAVNDPQPGDVPRGIAPNVKGRVIDASEGTRLDPLLNKTYDLNSPKTVPVNIFSLAGAGTNIH